MIKDTDDMLNLRWRAAQWMLAASDGDEVQQKAQRDALLIEGLEDGDLLDEVALLQRQFGHRPIVVLRDEVARLWSKMMERP